MNENAKKFRLSWRKAAVSLFQSGEIDAGELFLLIFILRFRPKVVAQVQQAAIESLVITDGAKAGEEDFDWEEFLEALISFLKVILPLFLS